MPRTEPMSDLSHAVAVIARRFAAEMPDRIATLREIALADRPGTLKALRRSAHNLAGVASTLGFNRTGDAASALEALACEAVDAVPPGAAPAIDAIAAAFADEAPAVLATP